MQLNFRLCFFLFSLPLINTFTADLQEFTGLRAYDKLPSGLPRTVFLLNFSQLWANYGGTVDFQLRSQGILLCQESLHELYSAKAIRTPRYQPGTRPLLEKVVKECCQGLDNPQEKALAIMRLCRDLYKKKPYPVQWEQYLFGGNEEQLLEKGEILCEALARLQVALCEIAGIPGRIVMHVVGGHVCCEIYTGENWGYLDPRMGIYFLDKQGKLLSVKDLIEQPQWVENQDDKVKNEVVAYANWEERSKYCKNTYFSNFEINLFEYYSLADADKYNYWQLTRQEADMLGLKEISRDYHKYIQEIQQQQQKEQQ